MNPCSTCSTPNPCPSYPNTECVVYTGVSLSCTGVKTNDRLNTIITKLDAKICSVIAGDNLYTDNTSSLTLLGGGTQESPLVGNVNISANAGNVITINSDGLYAPSSGLTVSYTSIFNEAS